MTTKASLSVHDDAVLRKLFDSEGPSGTLPPSFQRAPPSVEDDIVALSNREKHIIADLDDATPSTEQILACVENLTGLIDESPLYASAYVNRAQARRMLIPYHDLFSAEAAHIMTLVMSDLDEAIRMASPHHSSQSVPPHQAGVLAAAHTHKGVLLLRAADLSRGGTRLHGLSDFLGRMDPEMMEEVASQELARGGKYGNITAQQLAVRTNPYAKMCGKIVSEAQRQELKEYMKTVT